MQSTSPGNEESAGYSDAEQTTTQKDMQVDEPVTSRGVNDSFGRGHARGALNCVELYGGVVSTPRGTVVVVDLVMHQRRCVGSVASYKNQSFLTRGGHSPASVSTGCLSVDLRRLPACSPRFTLLISGSESSETGMEYSMERWSLVRSMPVTVRPACNGCSTTGEKSGPVDGACRQRATSTPRLNIIPRVMRP